MNKKNIYSKLASWCASFLVFIICLFVATKVIIANVEGVPPAIFGYSLSEVPTNSMEPTINTGDYVFFHQTDYEDVLVGDIIVYKSKAASTNGMFIIHRVISIEDGYLTTKGDNNLIADEEHITPDMVHGKYVLTVNFLSFLGDSSKRQNIFFFLMALLFLIIILQLVLITVKAKKAKEDEKLKQEVLEQMRKEILAEELRKQIIEENNKK